jgi:hypothetical protein
MKRPGSARSGWLCMPTTVLLQARMVLNVERCMFNTASPLKGIKEQCFGLEWIISSLLRIDVLCMFHMHSES